ncbi:beta-N-acetylglucosaminidase domain-containing protein [Streptomyces sp. NPDC057638]|uniref:beta-N-acetylglucosaminidase domain-containing protein n=1 Tax=Streptomyces sp. NPDC057638 TaxID=3346190 RepID=UPI0036AC7412
MRIARGRRTATAVAVAVMGGLLSGAPGAAASPAAPPGAPGPPTRTAADPTVDGGPPAVWPRPQSIAAAGPSAALGREVTLVADPAADPRAVTAAQELLLGWGVETVHTAAPGRGTLIRLGGSGAQEALRALRAPQRADLPSGGYRIAVGRLKGRAVVAVDGVGESGLFHGVQTLRQLAVPAPRGGTALAGVTVRDWPGTAVRGVTEGFYGEPWSHPERLAHLDFMGRTKQNRYLYAPGDDPFRHARWRDPYPAERRAEFRELAQRARAQHITLAWAVAPAQEMCLADRDDVRALLRKVDAMWALGVRAFQLQFQDVSYSEWHCDRDARLFGSGPKAAATAHARLAGEVARHLAERHPDAEPLSVLPTEYYQEGETEYRRALAAALDPRVQVAWTGVGVVPRTITGKELAATRSVFGHPLVTMDNYPVNDYAQDRIFLGPYTGREPAVAGGSAALLANAMEQASASRIPLFTAADYAWNPRGYRPEESWQAALTDLAGGDPATRAALGALAGHHASSLLGSPESAYLQPLLRAFWSTRAAAPAARDQVVDRLRRAFSVMRGAPAQLTGPAEGRLDDDVRPWLERLSRYGRAGELAVDMLQAQVRGDGTAAWRFSLALEKERAALAGGRVTVGKGVLDPFLARAATEAAAWTGADRVADRPGADTLWLDRPRPIATVTAMTEPGTGPATLEAHVPGRGWQRLGALSPTGWTQADARGLTADALRVSRTGPEPVGVRALVPWFADEPVAGVDLVRGETDAEIGGGPQRAGVELTPRRPGAVNGTLTAKAPKGIKVSVPKKTTVPRGVRTTVPVEVSVPEGTPAGEYRVPLSFGGEERTLTVRAYPRTGGTDLANGGTATSSGDETADFPAASAADGDPGTRWSSPAQDDAWWQVELAEPARVGRVVLRWQDAYASAYRIEVSADGRTWRTAATVAEGRGGRESVRMDAPGTRFIRVQGDARATRFGYSLWSVEAYAVVPE